MLYREALVVETEKTLNHITSTRAAMAQVDEYKGVVNRLKQAVHDIRVGFKEVVRNNWEDLRRGA